jgi:hypothetical protein
MLLPGPLKNFLRGGRGSTEPVAPASGPVRPSRSTHPLRMATGEAIVTSRNSRGLDEFFGYIRNQSGLTLLDLGIATQQNISFITNLGHRLYSEDFLQILTESFGLDDTTDQSNPGRIEFFLKQALDYPEGQFDGVLVWDVLEYLEAPLLNAVIERLHRIVRPKSYMLAFFHADDKLDSVPFYTFRIQETNLLQVEQKGLRRPTQLFNNRAIEKVFGRFESVKFFLTRERLREVIVKV